MSYKEMSRRLADLELAQDSVRTAQHGTAPEVWPRLAQWALAVHASGGWEVAHGIVNRGGLLAGPCPYHGNAAHPHVFPHAWDVQFFYRAGTHHWPTPQQQAETCWLIAACVADLVEQGAPGAQIRGWDVGYDVWNVIQRELAG